VFKIKDNNFNPSNQDQILEISKHKKTQTTHNPDQMFETLKHKKSQAKQSRSDVQSPNTNNLKPRTYNLTTFMFLKKQTLKFCFCLQKYAEDQRWWCLKTSYLVCFFLQTQNVELEN
jgi:hypothetical protein